MRKPRRERRRKRLKEGRGSSRARCTIDRRTTGLARVRTVAICRRRGSTGCRHALRGGHCAIDSSRYGSRWARRGAHRWRRWWRRWRRRWPVARTLSGGCTRAQHSQRKTDCCESGHRQALSAILIRLPERTPNGVSVRRSIDPQWSERRPQTTARKTQERRPTDVRQATGAQEGIRSNRPEGRA